MTDERFEENGFGLSFLKPAGAVLDPHPSDGAVAAWHLGDRASLRLRIRRSELMIETLEPLVELTWKDSLYGLTTAQPNSLEAERRRIAERPGLVQIVELVPQAPLYLQDHQRAAFDTRPLFFGQALIKLGPFSVASLEVYAPYELRGEAEALLIAVLGSARLVPPPDLYESRKASFQTAATWLEQQDFAQLAERVDNDAWFELRRNGEAIGYARERWWTEPDAVSRRDVALAEPGFVSARYTSTQRQNTRLITELEAYFTPGVDKEVWSNTSTLTTTVQQGGGVFEDRRVSSKWTETGVRNDDEISLVFETPPDADALRNVFEGELKRAKQEIELGIGPGMVNQNLLEGHARIGFIEIPNRLPRSRLDGEEPVPPTGLYLSQATLPLIPASLAKGPAGGYAFYAYDSDAGTLALRAYEVQPDRGIGAVVIEQPTPWSPVTTYRFDARGRLTEIVRPGGTTWSPTTKDALANRFPELR
ncbi:MAG: RHS repeat domain-containing protein [Planctomycetota bacterium]